MSLLARRLWRSAGRGQGAPGLRAPRLRTLCARSRDAGGARAGAGGRQTGGDRACGGLCHLPTRTRGGRTGSSPSPPPPPPPFWILRRDVFWGSR